MGCLTVRFRSLSRPVVSHTPRFRYPPHGFFSRTSAVPVKNLRSIISAFAVLMLANVLSGATSPAESTPPVRSDDGLPFYSIYNLDYLGQGSVRVALCEDPTGRLVAIDTGSVMVFDGNSWTLRNAREGSDSDSVAAAAVGPDGKFYAGAVARWGTLDQLPSGDYVFKAFDATGAPGWISAATFELVVPTGKGVFFSCTLGTVFQGYDGSRHFWSTPIPVQSIFEVHDEVYLASGSGGLYHLKDGEWQVIPGTERYGGNDAFVRKVECDNGRVVLATSSGKVFYFDGQTLTPMKTDADQMFLSSGIVDMVALPSCEIAFAVRGYGVVVVNGEGRVVMRIGYDHDDTFAGIRGLFQQENGVLWASLPGGVAKIYYPSQATFYDYRMGMPMYWPQVYHLNGNLVIYTDYRVFLGCYDMAGCLSRFEEINLTGGELIESCFAAGDDMLFSVSGTLYSYSGSGTPKKVMTDIPSARMCQIQGHPDYILVLGTERHALAHKENGEWKVVQTIPSMGFPAALHVSHDGDMWIEHGLGRVSRIRFENGKVSSQDIDNIPDLTGSWVNIWELDGRIYLGSGNIVKRFDPQTREVVPAPELKPFIEALGGRVSRCFQAPDGTIWASGPYGVFLVRSENGRYFVDRTTLRPVTEANTIASFDGDNVVWLLSRNRIVRYDASRNPPRYRELHPVASLITATDRKTNLSEIVQMSSSASSPLELPNTSNSVALRLFSNTYSLPSPPSYRYRLLGQSDKWSIPANEPFISFSGLSEGKYDLEVEILDHNISVGATSSFHFKVLPKWSQTWWAYFAYFNFALAFVLTIVRISQRHSEKERRRLEQLVMLRTSELDDTNNRLRESIRSAMAAAEAKSRFLANMSHEIRTPMNGVVGTTELLSRTPLSAEQRELVEIINKSGNLLLSIVNDVLDYSKIEADQLVFELIPLRPQNLIEDVLEILGEKANEKRVDFFGCVDSSVPLELIGDTTRVQQVLVNLCSNALKFTDHGEVELKCWAKDRPDGRCDVSFSVRDTGIGMDPKRMNRLFKAFSQLDASNTRVYGGTGLGLAISKRLVERMGGAMEVTSEVGRGSCFQLTIPLPISDRSAPALPPDGTAGRALLLADNCVSRRALVAAFLSRNGFDVAEMSLADAVVALDSGREYDAVVSDCPADSTAWTLLANAVSKNLKRVPLLVYRLPLQQVEHPAIVRRLSKPWRCNRLVAELRACLDSRHEEAEAVVAKPQENHAADSAAPADTSSLKILLAEDNAVNQRVAVLLLARLGLKPDLANNGQEAVNLVHAQHYDIVLMDVQMPVMDGIQATLAIRGSMRHDEQPIIVALTAGAMSSDRDAAFSAGVDAYLTKPLRLETLREQLNDLMEKVRMRRSATA